MVVVRAAVCVARADGGCDDLHAALLGVVCALALLPVVVPDVVRIPAANNSPAAMVGCMFYGRCLLHILCCTPRCTAAQRMPPTCVQLTRLFVVLIDCNPRRPAGSNSGGAKADAPKRAPAKPAAPIHRRVGRLLLRLRRSADAPMGSEVCRGPCTANGVRKLRAARRAGGGASDRAGRCVCVWGGHCFSNLSPSIPPFSNSERQNSSASSSVSPIACARRHGPDRSRSRVPILVQIQCRMRPRS